MRFNANNNFFNYPRKNLVSFKKGGNYFNLFFDGIYEKFKRK